MTKSVDFYFDFISPYSFLAHKKLQSQNKNNQIIINYKPILLGGLHNIIGITAPAFINPKAKFMVRVETSQTLIESQAIESRDKGNSSVNYSPRPSFWR